MVLLGIMLDTNGYYGTNTFMASPCRRGRHESINQSINHSFIAPISPAKHESDGRLRSVYGASEIVFRPLMGVLLSEINARAVDTFVK